MSKPVGLIAWPDSAKILCLGWGRIDKGGIQDFRSESLLIARIAVCVLHPTEENVSSFSEQLSWFLEVLSLLGKDARAAMRMMGEHFEYRE